MCITNPVAHEFDGEIGWRSWDLTDDGFLRSSYFGILHDNKVWNSCFAVSDRIPRIVKCPERVFEQQRHDGHGLYAYENKTLRGDQELYDVYGTVALYGKGFISGSERKGSRTMVAPTAVITQLFLNSKHFKNAVKYLINGESLYFSDLNCTQKKALKEIMSHLSSMLNTVRANYPLAEVQLG